MTRKAKSSAPKKLKVVVSRKRWLRGGTGSSYLLHPKNQKMCCLGFACRVAGIPAGKIRGKPFPSDVVDGIEATDPRLSWAMKPPSRAATIDDKDWIEQAAGINDASHLPDAKREARLRTLFTRHGHSIRFVP